MSYEIKHFVTAISLLTVAAAGACSSDESGGKGKPEGGTGGDEAGTGGGGRGGGGGGAGGGSGGAGGRGTGGALTDGGDGGPTDGGVCGPPDGCACNREETCDYVCAANCVVECLGGTCTAGCAEGGCTLDADFGGIATYACLGGHCTTDCDLGSTCNVDCSGGGCELTCDGGSTCSMSCSPTGDPCTVTCANGGVATCTSGNCTTQGCADGGVCDDTPDPNYNPTIAAADFSTTIDNPLFPLPVGATWTLRSTTEEIVITVLSETKVVMGVTCVVVRDTVKTLTGEVIEDTYDWYAQHTDGSVWYFGEDTKEYLNGQVASTHGSWEAGVGGALPGIVMPANPTLTSPPTPYRQEYWVCEAEDQAEVIAVDESITVPSGNYTGCVRTRDFTRLDITANEYKVYCPDVGNVLVGDQATGDRLEELTAVTIP